MGNKSALQLEVEKEMGFEIDEDLFAYLEHYARRKLEVANKSAGRAWGEDGYGDEYLSLLIPDVIREMAFSAYCDQRSAEKPGRQKGGVVMKNENAIMDRIKARIAYHANEHRHTYEIGKGVMDFLARDLLADFKAAGGLFPPVALDGDVYVIYRRKPVKAKVIFIGINADRLFFFNVLRGNIKANFQTYQFTENDIGRSVFLTLEEAEKAVA